MEEKKEVVVKQNVGDEVIGRIEALCSSGFTMPADFSYVNAIKGAMLVLQEVVNKDKVPALQCCTKASIQNALFKMAILGLDVNKKQLYFLVRGDKLCCEESYFGTCLQARRVSENFEPIANIIYKGDVFKYEISPETGRKKIIEHTQTLESLDSGEMVGAYAFVTNAKGETDIEVMTMAMIKRSWAKSSSQQQTVHREYPDQMARRTVIKRAAKMLINSSMGEKVVVDDELEPEARIDSSKQIEPAYADFEEVPTTEAVDLQAESLKPEPKKQGRPAKEVADKPKEEVKAEAPIVKDEEDF